MSEILDWSSSTQLRRSTRTRKEIAPLGQSETYSKVDIPQRKAKKRRTDAEKDHSAGSEPCVQPSRRVRGLLQRLKEFPLDIVFIIFEHLTPQDLLSLARTSKDLRKLLLSRSTASVWKAARTNVQGLPDTPTDMSEPAYAHLCFDSQCHHCDRKNPAYNILWRSRTRSCNPCLEDPSRYFSEPVVSQWMSGGSYTREFVPPSGSLNIPRKLWPIIKSSGEVIPRRQQSRNFTTRHFVCLVEIQKAFVDEFAANSDDPVWMATKTAEAEAREKHAKELEIWGRNKSDEHKSELMTKRKARRDAILQRLSDLGWAEEIEHQRQWSSLSCLSRFKIGTQAKKLTEKDWNALRPKLVAALQNAREDRLKRELRLKWRQRYLTFQSLVKAELDKLPSNTVGPNIADLASLPQFQEKLFLSIDHDLTEADLSDLFLQLPEIRSQWIRSREEDLIDLIKRSNGNTALQVGCEELRHAHNIFSCSHCSSPCVYPRPLMHPCVRFKIFGGGYFPLMADPCLHNYFYATGGQIWSVDSFYIDKELVDNARDIVSAVGLPVTATVEDVRRSDKWIVCVDRLGYQHMSPVPYAIYGDEAHMRPRRDWTVATDEAVAKAISSIDKDRDFPYSSDDSCMCRRCGTSLKGWDITEHMKSAHDLNGWGSDDLILGVDGGHETLLPYYPVTIVDTL